PLDDSVQLDVAPANMMCDYAKYQATMDLIKVYEQNMSTTNDFQSLVVLRYNMDVLSFMDVWQTCTQQASNYLVLETKNVTLMSSSCPYDFDTPQFVQDPCCNRFYKFRQCCLPRSVTLTKSVLRGFDSDLISDQCTSPGCTKSVLQDYYSSAQRLDSGECQLSMHSIDQRMADLVDLVQSCKDQAYQTIWCKSDGDCPTGGVCSLYTRACLTSPQSQDKAYITCVLGGLAKSTIYTLKQQLGASNLTDSDPILTDLVYNRYRMLDCVSPIGNNNYRTKYVRRPLVRLGKYPCYDTLCKVLHNANLDYSSGLLNPWTMALPIASTQVCALYGLCPGREQACLASNPACANTCTKGNFCGYCSSPNSLCHVFPSLTNATTCPDNRVCLLSNGVFNTTATDAECSSMGSCSTNCGYKCAGPYTGCFHQGANFGNCSVNYTWDPTNSLCTAPSLSNQQCTDQGLSWVDCSTMTEYECTDYRGSNPTVPICSAQPIACTTREQCESAGTCTDLVYLDTALGRCVRNHTQTVDPGQPACLNSETDSPMGCYNQTKDQILTKAQCTSLGLTWWTAATSKDQCLSPLGCLMTDYSNTTVGQRRFNEMGEQQCNQCGASDQYQWTNKFAWTPAKWLPGVMTNAQWYSNVGFVQGSTYQDSFSLDAFATNLSAIVMFSQTRSSCQFQRVQVSVDTIACSCSGPGNSQCFQSTSVPTQTVQVCALEQQKSLFANGYITFNSNSVASQCINVKLLDASRQTMAASPTRVALSAEFVNYLAPIGFGVTNKDGAFIGQVIGDGVGIDGAVSNYTLCLGVDSDASIDRSYHVYDLGLRQDNLNQSNLLLPMEVTTVPGQSKDGQSLICATITQDITGYTVFPIARVSNWRTAKREYFTNTQRVLMYILATMYCLCAVWGLFQIGIIILKLVNRHEGTKLTHALITAITAFTLIRAIYFYMLPSGTLYSFEASDYVLVILPTFIYFTSFSFILALWYIIISSDMLQNYMKRLKRIIIVLNGVLYIACIIIILVFNFSKSTRSSSFCGGRFLETLSNSKTQTIISYFYGILQATISLVFGVTFIYLGIRINNMLGHSKERTLRTPSRFKALANRMSDRKVQLFFVTVTCSFGLILHSVFVLVLVSARYANMIFSFICLILSELLPAFTIFTVYNQGKVREFLKNSGGSGGRPSQASTTMSSTEAGSKMRTLNSSGSMSTMTQ
ncbi:hypothetical protein SAMD00019534_070960, partial [Acytostelium subglobosum LB1]|uniref:hypothetical protein n=1 Tax=Acytostelium subglobosum LB1 TaxID=1410327 RepID=UPI000644E780